MYEKRGDELNTVVRPASKCRLPFPSGETASDVEAFARLQPSPAIDDISER